MFGTFAPTYTRIFKIFHYSNSSITLSHCITVIMVSLGFEIYLTFKTSYITFVLTKAFKIGITGLIMSILSHDLKVHTYIAEHLNPRKSMLMMSP